MAHKGKKHSPETIQKMRDAKLGKPSGFKGKTHNAASVAQIAATISAKATARRQAREFKARNDAAALEVFHKFIELTKAHHAFSSAHRTSVVGDENRTTITEFYRKRQGDPT